MLAELPKVGTLAMHITECSGYGRQLGHRTIDIGNQYDRNLVPKVMLELVVPIDYVKVVIEAVIKGARTGQIGDGKIFIASIDEVVGIRTNERNHQALI